MIKANFNTYASYVTDSLYQWDINQVLSVSGLNLKVAPEIHFSNSNMDRAIVRQATLDKLIVSVNIPNSLLQEALTIKAHIGIYEGDTFKVVELIEIPVIAKTRPSDYKIENTDEEIYSFEALKNDIANMVTLKDYNANNSSVSASISKVNSDLTARIDNIIAHNNDTDGNTELVDIRLDIDNNTHASAGEAVRYQLESLSSYQRSFDTDGYTTLNNFAKWTIGGMTSAVILPAIKYRVSSTNILCFDRDIKVKIADGFRAGFHILDENDEFVSDKGWQQKECYIRANTRFKMVISRVTEVTTETANLLEFSNAVTFTSYIYSEMKKIDNTVAVCDKILKLTTGETIYPKGTYYTSNHNPPDNNRIHANDMVCESFLVVTAHDEDPGYYYGVDLYTNDGSRTWISSSGWLRMNETPNYIVSQNCIVDISIAKLSDAKFTDLSEMDGLIEVTVYDTIESLKREVSKNKNQKTWLTSAHRGYVDSTLKENTLGAFYNAYVNGADMIEIDARLSSDGVLICNHDATVTGLNANGETVTYTIAETPSSDICSLTLSNSNKWGEQKVPTVEQVLNLAYNTGLIVNIDMKNGYNSAEAIAKLVLKCGMRGRVIYATNGSGMLSINKILEYDSQARFIDSNFNFTSENLADLEDYRSKCYAYTSDISDETITSIRESGCMLALISLNASNFESAIKYNPDMCEYLHTSNFKEIESDYFENVKLY